MLEWSGQRLALSLYKRMHTLAMATAGGDSTAATAFVARYIQRVLQNFREASRAETRAPSPGDGAGLIDSLPPPEGSSLDEIVRTRHTAR